MIMKKLQLLFTLLLPLLITGNANAASHFDVGLYYLDSYLWGKVVPVTVSAHFDARVQSWQLDVSLPEGLTIVDYSAGSDMYVHYTDQWGDFDRDCLASLERQGNTFIGTCPEVEGYWIPENGRSNYYDYESYGNIKWEAGDYSEMMTLRIAVSEDFHGGMMKITTTTWATEDARGGTVIENGEHGQPYVENKEIPFAYLEALPPIIETEQTASGDLLVTVTASEGLSLHVFAYNGDGLIHENNTIGMDQFVIYRTMNHQEITIHAEASDQFLMPSATEYTYWLDGFDGDPSFEKDGIYYKYTSPGEVKVTWAGESRNHYTGQVDIPSTVTHDGQNYRVTAIGVFAFNECDELTGVTIPESVTTIETLAFVGCFNLTHITLPASLTAIHREAFDACYNLKSVTTLALTAPTIHKSSFNCPWTDDETRDDAIHRFATLYVPRQSLEGYSADPEWRKFEHIQAIDKSGDVDGDGKVSITDSTSLIDLLLGGEQLPEYADVNGDGRITIIDITTLIDLLLSND